MVLCRGCGFNVEQRDVLSWPGLHPVAAYLDSCVRCKRCTPDVREAYRRGFNSGVTDMARTVGRLVENEGRVLHKRRGEEDDVVENVPQTRGTKP